VLEHHLVASVEAGQRAPHLGHELAVVELRGPGSAEVEEAPVRLHHLIGVDEHARAEIIGCHLLSGISGVETNDCLRCFTYLLSAICRQSVARNIPPPQPEADAEPKHRPAHVARMRALIHQLQEEIDRGEYKNQAILAHQLGFSRGRFTKLLDLTLLASLIEEEVMSLEAKDVSEPIKERTPHEIVRRTSLTKQRHIWHMWKPG